MKNISVGLFLLVIALSGCNTLHKSQMTLIGNYYSILASYPGSFKKINDRAAKVILESNNLSSALHATDSARVTSLIQSIEQYDKDLTPPDSILIDIDALEKYIRGYYVLVPNGFNVYKALKSTSESIGGMFGLRSVVSTILPEATSRPSNSKKRKIERHFKSQSTQFRSSLQNLKYYIDIFIIPGMEETDVKIQDDVRALFTQSSSPLPPRDHYFTYNQYFIDFFQKIGESKKLYVRISRTVELILETEAEIQKMTKERNKLSKDSELLHRSVNEIQKLKVLIDQLELDNSDPTEN